MFRPLKPLICASANIPQLNPSSIRPSVTARWTNIPREATQAYLPCATMTGTQRKG